MPRETDPLRRRGPVRSVSDFAERVLAVWERWKETDYEDRWVPWFRGEPARTRYPLVPKLYRRRVRSVERENDLLQFFRFMGPHPFYGVRLDTKATHHWLYLAQHVRMPTRLLDWTEGALIALFFALDEKMPRVWMLHPLALNLKSGIRQWELAWHNPLVKMSLEEAEQKRVGYKTNASVRAAWEKDKPNVGKGKFRQRFPIALYPTHVHPRMTAQRAGFTIHGTRTARLVDCVPKDFLRRIDVSPDARTEIRRQLRVMGVSNSTLFPDFDGLARDLEHRFTEEEDDAY